jgi:GSH-dependent disulfide-bond oxidoreductase
MIDLYTWSTPNGRKVSIMLEELALPYNVHPVNVGKDDQFKPEFVAINPNSKIPAIVDPEGPDGRPVAMMESGAILIYLADKTGKLMPASQQGRYEALQWLMFQISLPARRQRIGAVCDRPLHEGNAAALWRAECEIEGP